jgi:hypothetical protein
MGTCTIPIINKANDVHASLINAKKSILHGITKLLQKNWTTYISVIRIKLTCAPCHVYDLSTYIVLIW